jgi:hypothetical protein
MFGMLKNRIRKVRLVKIVHYNFKNQSYDESKQDMLKEIEKFDEKIATLKKLISEPRFDTFYSYKKNENFLKNKIKNLSLFDPSRRLVENKLEELQSVIKSVTAEDNDLSRLNVLYNKRTELENQTSIIRSKQTINQLKIDKIIKKVDKDVQK